MIEQTNQLEQFEGYVIFVLINKETKSERYAPLLLLPGGNTILLHYDGDYSLQSKSLLPYHKAWCKLSGQLNKEKNAITVSSVEKADDPFASFGPGIDVDGDYKEPQKP